MICFLGCRGELVNRCGRMKKSKGMLSHIPRDPSCSSALYLPVDGRGSYNVPLASYLPTSLPLSPLVEKSVG
ncbi:hypothetical protein CEXT_271871 [Caerostris extrusa]|uniref:Uncharacterized protein n=1 Tax=Caerostris extrusa TaxID=172846 RepID=A0AAV4NMA3_CAEEX|nr:hypothetical protein CEXT_271871 [Caerostris extrusa]